MSSQATSIWGFDFFSTRGGFLLRLFRRVLARLKRSPRPDEAPQSLLPDTVPSRRLEEEIPTVFSVLKSRAIAESADFIEPLLDSVMVFKDNSDNRAYSADLVNRQRTGGLCLEFGVFEGKSLNFFAESLPDMKFYGFDSFEGLAEDWIGYHLRQGHFSLNSRLPEVRENVQLVTGLFEDSLPSFVASHNLENLRFLHIDCDTYPATRTVLRHMAPFLKRGVMMLFDEFLGYPNWKNGEFRALAEAQSEFSFGYKFRSFGHMSALIEIT